MSSRILQFHAICQDRFRWLRFFELQSQWQIIDLDITKVK